MRFVVPPKFKTGMVSFGLLDCGEDAVGVSAPAPPLSFVQAERSSFSGQPLSVDGGSGVLLRRLAVYSLIVAVFRQYVKRWAGCWRD